ncbi:MAG: hypothetical protein R2695_11160 [Acidimicrobiales bacterium]
MELLIGTRKGVFRLEPDEAVVEAQGDTLDDVLVDLDRSDPANRVNKGAESETPLPHFGTPLEVGEHTHGIRNSVPPVRREEHRAGPCSSSCSAR